MNLYVAGKTQDYRRIRTVQKYAVVYGHRITHDWTAVVAELGGDSSEVPIPDEVQQRCAVDDMKGVRKANVVIALGHPDVQGTIWECGAAAAWGMPIWLVEWQVVRHTVFVHLPQVERIDMTELFKRLRGARPPWQEKPKRPRDLEHHIEPPDDES